uniref:Uncharacterized protein n=1 Tax=Arion vulgaris TaxID=1028688 RepID=A0A0B6ZY22_9EUPU
MYGANNSIISNTLSLWVILERSLDAELLYQASEFAATFRLGDTQQTSVSEQDTVG